MPHSLTFLKLGGSLITDKAQPLTPRLATLARLAQEIAAARRQDPTLRLVLGHGSGSFGHVPARQYGTRQGVHTPEQWQGFTEVWQAAAALDHLVLEALHAAGLPAMAFAPSAAVTAQAGQVATWDLHPLQAALAAGLLPIVYGDVVFDTVRGGTILSTEELFDHLAPRLQPGRVLLAGLEAGVWADFPACARLIPELTPANLAQHAAALGGAQATDVTGGMAAKVHQALALTQALPGLEVLIFSGETPGAVQAALGGAAVGTRLSGANRL